MVNIICTVMTHFVVSRIVPNILMTSMNFTWLSENGKPRRKTYISLSMLAGHLASNVSTSEIWLTPVEVRGKKPLISQAYCDIWLN